VPYLPIGVFMLFLYFFLPGISNNSRDISTLTSLTLIPFGNPALSVAWTLSFELIFYLLFSISFISQKSWYWFVLIWFSVIIIFNYAPITSLQLLRIPFFRTLISPYNIEFIIGFIFAELVIKKIKINKVLVLMMLTVSFLSFIYCTFNNIKVFSYALNLLFASVAFLTIFIAIGFGTVKISSTSVMMIVGNITYSIYLVHNPLQMIIIRMYPKINGVLGAVIALGITLIISCFVGYGYYLVCEKKAIQIIKFKIIK